MTSPARQERGVLFFILAAGLLAVLTPRTHAAETITAKERPMADLRTTVQATRAEVERDYLHQAFPSPVQAFAFELMIPKDWQWFEKDGRPAKADGRLQLLARYGEKNQEAITEVYAQQIEREVAPEDWLDPWMAANHYTVVARRSVPSDAGRNADVLASRSVQGQPYLYRLRTFKNGKFIYLLHSFAPERRYAAAEDAFLVAAASFKLTEAKPQPTMEILQDVALNKVFQLGFKVPASWTVRADDSVDANCQSWGLSNGTGADRAGMINVYTAPHDRFRAPDQIAHLVANGMRHLGANFADGALREVPTGTAGVSFWTADAPATLGQRSALVRQTVVATAKGWAVFTLVTPAGPSDPYLVTAINKRAFDIAITSLLNALAPAG
ncbi:hypothetical protein [Nitrospirillum amazonense]|uniref:Uncharacterized protein n=1 Tax=Nitrospirillum amazonense TaxID=28077 RepID=A0A560IYX5_9PROT|nr:hypothetical protein [Nitrospirillum amazonense]MDG3442719.1 hypothetical protein [Nitrospirillum amazonense]TWB64106.1 hypothetical protein FBZ87_1264 [Nitrospirillum amazonense]